MLTALKHRHLLGIADLSPEEIVLVLDTAEAMKEVGQRAIKKVPTLRGRTVINLFFEPSTRTRTSFEIAEKRLSADTLNVAIASSSVVKGETLVDTAMNLEALAPSMIVLRHASSGACHLLSRICKAAKRSPAWCGSSMACRSSRGIAASAFARCRASMTFAVFTRWSRGGFNG